MSDKKLSRLTRIDLREVWNSEATDFTPWLAREENLSVLAETLGLDLELEAQERAVGPFRADVLCKDIGSGAWVLIENQLERTDHTHLGQLLTYASGLEAVTIVWIAARFTEEHRSTLDWLNKITDETFRFFGLEVELWRIGESPAAPKFNIVSKPNDWSRSVSHAARAIDDSELSDTRLLQRDYWTLLHKVLEIAGGPVLGNRTPQLQSWMPYPIGRTGFSVNAASNKGKRQIRAELYLAGRHAKTYFRQLFDQRQDIESALGKSLAWEELPQGLDSRIAIYLEDSDPENKSDWPRQHQWLADWLNNLHRVFAPRVRMLDATQGNSPSGDGHDN
jgi:hypothetical protein